MAPALRIPFELDMKSLQQQSQEASGRVGETLKGVGRAFTKLNGELVGIAKDGAAGIGLAYGQGLATSLTRLAATGAATVAAFKVLSGAISETREQLERMVEIADKAQNTGVGADFFQRFLLNSRNLKVEAGELEGALESAFRATRERSPIDVNAWSAGEEKITDVEKALRVYNATLAKAAGQKLEGLVLFRDAQNQEEKVQAVLKAMVQLEQIGQRAAALDLGERMFGSQLIERIRQGRTSAQGILDSMAQAQGFDIFPQETVARAKELDDKLKEASARLNRELTPQWNDLAKTILFIKSVWTDIISLMASAAAWANRIDIAAKKDEIRAIKEAIERGTGLYGVPRLPGADTVRAQLGLPSIDESLKARLAKAEQELANMEGPARPPTRVTVNSRGTGAAPTQDTGSVRDRFDASLDSISKRTAALDAETRNVNANTFAREKARIAAELEAVAKQANTQAGINNGEVTAEQKKRIDEVAESWGRAAQAAENARSPLATFARESANVVRALNAFAATSLDRLTDTLASLGDKSTSVADKFRAMASSILQDLARIAIRKAITGPLAAGLGGLFGGGFDEGGFTGAGGKYEPAGIVHRGEYVFDAGATQRIGVANLARLHKGYAEGGMVGGVSSITAVRSGRGGATAGLRVEVSLDNDMLRAVVRDESGSVVARATPKIVSSAVTQANASAPGAVARFDRERGGEYRA